jgi:prephenate dehydratase
MIIIKMIPLTLGPLGSNSHVALIKYCRLNGMPEDNISFRGSNYEIVETVSKKPKKYSGIVAFENSGGGLVQETIEALDIFRPKINGEVLLPVSHYLASKSGEKKDVKEVVSHSQALKQCRKYLRINLDPFMETREVESTSHAAELASENEDIAAICTRIAAQQNSLKIIDSDIQDSNKNVTRFVTISNKDCEKPTGRDKTTVRYNVVNKPAALYNALGVFAKRKLNLSMQHSIPTGEMSQYYMLTDVEAHRMNPDMEEALTELGKWTVPNSIFIYGSYPRAKNL